MFSGDNKCRKKILFICSFFLAALLSFVCALRPFAANALSPSNYQVYFNVYGYNNDQYSWGPEINVSETFYASNVRRYQWKIDSIPFTGNYLSIHFETNIVYPFSANEPASFSNLDNLFVSYCGSSGSNGTIRSSSISYSRTNWDRNGENFATLTLYGNAVVSGLQFTSGNHDLYCGIATQSGNPFLRSLGINSVSHWYIEQSPTSVQFTNDISDALDSSRNNILNNIDNSINNVYNQQKQDELDKEQELNSQSDNLSLSASNIVNPFISFFDSRLRGYNTCYTTTSIHSLFNALPFKFCPISFGISGGPTIFRAVASLFTVGLLIRLYYKKLKGGRDG